MNTSLSPEERADLLLAQMTLEEKVDMLSEKSGAGLPPSRLGIPTLTFADGPAGIRIDRTRRDVNEGKATSPPAPIALAATWDPLVAQQYGDLVGLEAWSTGHNVLFGPGLDIVRIPLFGRLFESLGEDPILTGQMAAHYIQGVQRHAVIATAKHYNVNAQEENRLEIDAQLDERTLQEIYTLPFEAAVKDGHIGAVMGAYNKINGTYCCEHPHVLTEILKQQPTAPSRPPMQA
jgi:beta-glucosidase